MGHGLTDARQVCFVKSYLLEGVAVNLSPTKLLRVWVSVKITAAVRVGFGGTITTRVKLVLEMS